jgi:hypothetical protein
MPEGYIPYCAYWSTPFARWQGSFAHLHALKFGASTAKAELARRNIPPQAFDCAVLGTTIPQHGSFYKTFKRNYARLSILPHAETVIALLSWLCRNAQGEATQDRRRWRGALIFRITMPSSP